MASNYNMHTSSRVAIIGAGVSGLAAAKYLARHRPQVFEASDSIGGVWRKCTYETTKLQSVRVSYEFSDFPWPNRGESSFPTYVEVLDYLEAYAKHFNLLKYIKFNCKVVEVRFIGDGQDLHMGNIGAYGNLLPGKPVWEVAVRTEDGDIKWHAFMFLVLCTGKYGDVPRIPTFPVKKGPEIFKGEVLHSMDYSKLDKEKASLLLRGKNVVVIGSNKSAIDLALESALANQVSRFIESYVLWKLPLEKYGLKPDHPFQEDYASCQMAIMPENFVDEADKGTIRFKRTKNWWFYDEGVEFEDGTTLEADVVILATGYDGMKKLKDIVPEPFRTWLEFPWGIIPLYRGTIHPLIPNMGFIGHVLGGSNLKSSEIHARWLSQLLDDKFKLPSKEKMLDQFLKEMDVMRRSSRFYRNHCFSTFSIQHADELCNDVNLKP